MMVINTIIMTNHYPTGHHHPQPALLTTIIPTHYYQPSSLPTTITTNHHHYQPLSLPTTITTNHHHYQPPLLSPHNPLTTKTPFSTGSFQVPHNGLYHVLVNLNTLPRYSDTTLKFSIVINNQTEAISKTTKLESGVTNTITIEGILDLVENQTISVTISNPDLIYTYLTISYGSTFFIFSKGILNSHSIRAVSTSYQDTSTEKPANRFSTLNKWDTSPKHSFTHYSNIHLQQGEFVAPKSGVYQMNFALYLSNCTTAKAKILCKNTNETYRAISPDVSFTNESIDCVLQNSLLLKLQKSDRLRLQVKSDMKYTVLSQTFYQVVFQASYTLWPAAIFILAKPFQFKTNSATVKVRLMS